VIWAVEAVGRRLPAIGTCLTQALSAHVLLGRIGQRSDLRIGVRRDATGTFAGHAWLEDDGVVLIGGSCHTSYAPMPGLRGLERRANGRTNDYSRDVTARSGARVTWRN
jgi:hypothetical protein